MLNLWFLIRYNESEKLQTVKFPLTRVRRSSKLSIKKTNILETLLEKWKDKVDEATYTVLVNLYFTAEETVKTKRKLRFLQK